MTQLTNLGAADAVQKLLSSVESMTEADIYRYDFPNIQDRQLLAEWAADTLKDLPVIACENCFETPCGCEPSVEMDSAEFRRYVGSPK